MSDKRETPRTDEYLKHASQYMRASALAVICRDLERSLAAKEAEVLRLRKYARHIKPCDSALDHCECGLIAALSGGEG